MLQARVLTELPKDTTSDPLDKVDQICLPYFCFQGPDTVDRDPGLDLPQATPVHEALPHADSDKQKAVPRLSAVARKNVASALRTLRTMIPQAEGEPQPVTPPLDSPGGPNAAPNTMPLPPMPELMVDGFQMPPTGPCAPLSMLGQVMPAPPPAPAMNIMSPTITPITPAPMTPTTPAPMMNTCMTPLTPSTPSQGLAAAFPPGFPPTLHAADGFLQHGNHAHAALNMVPGGTVTGTNGLSNGLGMEAWYVCLIPLSLHAPPGTFFRLSSHPVQPYSS